MRNRKQAEEHTFSILTEQETKEPRGHKCTGKYTTKRQQRLEADSVGENFSQRSLRCSLEPSDRKRLQAELLQIAEVHALRLFSTHNSQFNLRSHLVLVNVKSSNGLPAPRLDHLHGNGGQKRVIESGPRDCISRGCRGERDETSHRAEGGTASSHGEKISLEVCWQPTQVALGTDRLSLSIIVKLNEVFFASLKNTTIRHF